MDFLIRPLKGDEDLWLVFWVYGVLVGLLMQIGQFYFAFNPIGVSPTLGKVADWSYTIFSYIYLVWINIAIWRCALNTESKSATFWARFGVVLTVLFTVCSLLFDLFGDSMMGAAMNAGDGSADPQLEQMQKILETLQKQNSTR